MDSRTIEAYKNLSIEYATTYALCFAKAIIVGGIGTDVYMTVDNNGNLECTGGVIPHDEAPLAPVFHLGAEKAAEFRKRVNEAREQCIDMILTNEQRGSLKAYADKWGITTMAAFCQTHPHESERIKINVWEIMKFELINDIETCITKYYDNLIKENATHED